jgi:hypothetical protein
MAPPFLTSALDGGEWSAACSGRYTPREIYKTSVPIAGMGRTVGLDAVKGKNCHVGIQTRAVHAVTQRYTD